MISGATKTTYKLVKKDKGKRITMRIYAGRTSHATGAYLTAAVKIKKWLGRVCQFHAASGRSRELTDTT